MITNHRNNGYYICQSHDENLKILSTAYLAKRIGITPTNTKNGSSNQIIKVYCIPFPSRVAAKQFISSALSILDNNWLDIRHSKKLTKTKNFKTFFSAYYLYLINEQKMVENIEEFCMGSSSDFKDIRKSVIKGSLNRSTKEDILKVIRMLNNNQPRERETLIILEGLLNDRWFTRESIIRLNMIT